MDGRFTPYVIDVDADSCSLVFPPMPSTMGASDGSLADAVEPDALTYEQPSPDELILRGRWQGHDVEIRLQKRDLEEMELLSREFHWINESPHNV
jgi:hypothetical protein